MEDALTERAENYLRAVYEVIWRRGYAPDTECRNVMVAPRQVVIEEHFS